MSEERRGRAEGGECCRREGPSLTGGDLDGCAHRLLDSEVELDADVRVVELHHGQAQAEEVTQGGLTGAPLRPREAQPLN